MTICQGLFSKKELIDITEEIVKRTDVDESIKDRAQEFNDFQVNR